MIPLFSLLFIINVKADTVINFSNTSFTPLDNCLNNSVCSSESDFWNNMLSYDDLIVEDSNYEYYTIYYYSNRLYYIRSHNPLIIRYGYNSGNNYLSLRFVQDQIAWREISYSFNSTGEITSALYWDYTYGGTDNFSLTVSANTLNAIILATNQENYIYGSYGEPVANSWTIDNGYVYSYNDEVPIDFLNGDTFNWYVTDYFNPVIPDNTCLKFPKQIGEASYVSDLLFNIRGNSRLHVKGYIDLRSNQLFQLANNNASDVTNISYELGDDNIAENVVFSYSVQWVNPNSNQPIYRIHYDLQDTTNAGFDSFMQVIMTVSINGSLSNINYFRDDMYIFVYDSCISDSISYGYVNYKDNNNVTSDPYLMNYMNNMSLPNMSFLSDLKSLFPQGPVDSILNLPLLMLNSVKSSLESTCQPLVITLPYVNKNLRLNCQNNFYSNIGLTNFFNSVGVIASTVILFQYFIFLYNWIDDVLKLGDTKLKAWGTGEVK